MKRTTFVFLASAIGISSEEYPDFFGATAIDITATPVVSEPVEHALYDWRVCHSSHTAYALMGFRLWHHPHLLEELSTLFEQASTLEQLQEITQAAEAYYGEHFMTETQKRTTQIEIVVPDQEYFSRMIKTGMLTAPSLGLHISALQHAVLAAGAEGIIVETTDSLGNT